MSKSIVYCNYQRRSSIDIDKFLFQQKERGMTANITEEGKIRIKSKLQRRLFWLSSGSISTNPAWSKYICCSKGDRSGQVMIVSIKRDEHNWKSYNLNVFATNGIIRNMK